MAKTNLKKGRLSNDDFETFKANIHLSDEQLADKLSRSVKFIENTRNRVYPNKKTGKWNKVDVIILQENCNSKSIAELSRLLNRAEKAIKSKIKSLNIQITGGTASADPNPYAENSSESVKEELFPEDELLEEDEMSTDDDYCCGEEGCCDQESGESKISFWRKVYNFLKVW